MEVIFSSHFTYNKLLRFVLPPILTAIFSFTYGVVDGMVVSNYVGKIAFAAVGMIMPFLVVVAALGFMLGSGGSAVVSVALGEGNREKANKYFTLFAFVTLGLAIIFSLVNYTFMPEVARLLGAEGALLENGVLYGRILAFSLPGFMLLFFFQSFFPVAGKPKLGLYITVLAGLTNIVLDLLFVVVFGWGLAGAAYATLIGEFLGGFLPLFYFSRKNDSLLAFTKISFEIQVLFKATFNGASEFLNTVSYSVVTMLYNFQLLNILGDNGVAAYGVISYVSYIFIGYFSGYAIGCIPLLGYNYGARNKKELKSLFKKSVFILAVSGIVMTGIAYTSAYALADVFVGYDQELLKITVHGFQLYSFAFLLYGINVFGSALFTAFNNGLVSGIVSFLHVLAFQVMAIMLLPKYFGLDGIWLAFSTAEFFSLITTVGFITCLWNVYFKE
ncbi:MAG: polysaccharide biosynthesis C-terminal domain-containing protein [Phascolarctobacterium sp.]|nr:polysaccharide biosynthesis C-terminal domain-containing protein [Phascolarctobacterium sp.]